MDQNTLHLTSLAYSLYSPVISGDLRIFTPAVCSGLCIEKMFSFYGEIFRGTCSGISASPVHICGSYLNHFQSLTNGEGASIYCRKPQPCCLGSLLLRDINSLRYPISACLSSSLAVCVTGLNMKTAFIQHLFKSVRAPATIKRYRDFSIGMLLVVLNQLVVIPIQIALDRRHIDLPASIFVMILAFLFMAIANHFHGGVARFYTAHLQGPTDFLGRHMSLGFVAPFVMLNRDHISEPLDVPRIAAAFGNYPHRAGVYSRS